MKIDKINSAINVKIINDDIEIKPLYKIKNDVYLFDLTFNTFKNKLYDIDFLLNSVDNFNFIIINFKKYELKNNFLKYNFIAKSNKEIIHIGLPFLSSFILLEIKNIKIKNYIENNNNAGADKIDNIKNKKKEKKVLEISNYVYKKKTDTLFFIRSYDYVILILNFNNNKKYNNFVKEIEKNFRSYKYLICWVSSFSIREINNIKYPHFLKNIKAKEILWCWFGSHTYNKWSYEIENFNDYWEIYYKIKGLNFFSMVNKFNFGNLENSITFITTACVRPDIYRETLSSLRNCVGNLYNFKLILNIDMIPSNNRDAIEMVKIAEMFFGEVIYNLSDNPNFVNAFKFVVNKVKSPWFFYVQDDWLFEKKFYLKDVMNYIMPYHNNTISCHLFKKDGGRNDDDKVYLSPSVMKTHYWKDIINKSPADYSIEKLFRVKSYENPKGGMFPEYRGDYYRVDTEPMVKDLGRDWIRHIGYRKDDNFLFTKWLKN